MKSIISTITIILISLSVFAVDGYKNLKFGMSKQESKDLGLCTFEEFEYQKNKLVSGLECNDLVFKGKKTRAYAYFINDKFLRIVIFVDESDVSSIVSIIRGKYGETTSTLTSEEIRKELSKPENSVWIGFGDNTVYLLMNTDSRLRVTYYLAYSSPTYDSEITKINKKELEDDI